MNKVKPVTPREVAKLQRVPDEVLEVFNELIAQEWDGHRSVVKQDDVLGGLLTKLPDVTRQKVFDKHWLDVEDHYRKVGWKVEYDRPGMGDGDYPATYTFTPMKGYTS